MLNIFQFYQTVPRMIPRSSLALSTALPIAMAQENAENCPADLVSFEVITGELVLIQTIVKMCVCDHLYCQDLCTLPHRTCLTANQES